MLRIFQFVIVLFGGLVATQQQALMDYLERRLLAIEVSLKFPVPPATPAHPEHKGSWFYLDLNAQSISSTNVFSFGCECMSF